LRDARPGPEQDGGKGNIKAPQRHASRPQIAPEVIKKYQLKQILE
jgi:hypothetical protein